MIGGPDALPALATELVVVGSQLMDLYDGPLSPREIADGVSGELAAAGRAAPDIFRTWVEAGGGFRTTELADDGSRWVLRMGDAERFVHVHPGRYSTHTVRVRAPVLTTAVMARAWAGIHGGDPLDRSVVNRVRREFLGLAPVGDNPTATGGLGAVIELLRT